MKKSILILFVLLSQVCIGQMHFGSGISYSGYQSKDMFIFNSIDSASSQRPELIITIHEEYNDLNKKQKAETIVKMEAWILSEKKKLKK